MQGQQHKLVLEIPLGGSPEDTFHVAAERLMLELGLEPDVSKAVAPHPAHFKPRGPGGHFTGAHPVYPVRLSKEARAAARVRATELQSLELAPRLQGHLADFMNGSIGAEDWYHRCAKDLRHFYQELYRCGKQAAGDPAYELTPTDRAILKRLVDDELDYLAGFRDHLKTGAGKMPYPERMALYASAAFEAFWSGWIMGDMTPGRMIRWQYGATENHCGIQEGGHEIGCSDFVKLGWVPVEQFLVEVLAKGYAPRSGMLECGGFRCLCFLAEKSPTGEISEDLPPYPEFQPALDGTFAHEAPQSLLDAARASRAAPIPVSAVAAASGAPSGIPQAPTAPQLQKFPGVSAGTTDQLLTGTKLKGNADALLPVALGGLWLLLVDRREPALKDAVAYLYFSAKHLAAYATDAEVLRRLVAIADRKHKWLRARHGLSEDQAEQVMKQAMTLGAFDTLGRFVTWKMNQWPEPHLEDYPDLLRTYTEAER